MQYADFRVAGFAVVSFSHGIFAPAEFRSSAIHLGGPNDIRACRGPISVEGGHIFLPPSSSMCPADACRPVAARGWIAEPEDNCHTSEGLLSPAEQHLAAMESEIHLPYRPVTRNRGDWLQSAAMHISRMPAAVTGVLRNPELVAAGGLPRMSEVCRCDKCFSRTANGAGTVSCARRVIYTVAPSAIASKLASLPASAYICTATQLIPLTFIQ